MKIALLLAVALAIVQGSGQTSTAPPGPPPKPKPPVIAPAPPSDGLAICVASCSRSYYFCLQENDPETCQPSWSTCRANCARTNQPPGSL